MIRKILIILAVVGGCLFLVTGVIDSVVRSKAYDKILTVEEAKDLEDVDCILVLGAGIKGGKPSDMLEDRLLTADKLYEDGVSPKILASGDHTKIDYDEVNVMKNYLLEELDIPSKDVFMDHAGISTYDSIYRAKEIFQAKKIIIVTQEYHLYRALYLADKIGVEAYGVAADLRGYKGQWKRVIREYLARNKDYFKGILLPESEYMGNAIPVFGDGDVTNDK